MMTPTEQHFDADLIVIGGGGSGLMAALCAAEQGLQVLLLEKAPQPGGTSAMSFGVFATSGSSHQAAQAIHDTPDAHFEDLNHFAGALLARDNLVLRRCLVEQAPQAFRKLQELGAVFSQPISETGHRVPRLHKMLPHSRAVTELVARRCRQLGVGMRMGAEVAELLHSEGRVTGVLLHDGSALRARHAVLLTTGDISNAPQAFKQQLLPSELVPIPGLNPLSTGDGQRLGVGLGGEVRNGDLVWGPEIRFVERPRPTLLSRLPSSPWLARLIKLALDHLPNALLRPFMMSFVTSSMRPAPQLFESGAIFVNRDGQRFADERDRPEIQAAQQPGGEVFVVFDQALAERLTQWPHYVSTAPVIDYAYLPDYQRHRKDLVKTGQTLAEAAQAAGISAQGLAQTVAQLKARGEPGPSRGPFYILGPARACIFFSEGGLSVNAQLQVLRQDGQPIDGLYAAGSAGQGGLLLNGHGHHIAWAYASGLLAAQSIVASIHHPSQTRSTHA